MREILVRVLVLIQSRSSGWVAAGITVLLWLAGEVMLPVEYQAFIPIA